MTQKLDYSREDAMEILNNVNFSDEEKRSQYEEYMSELKKTRKNAIVTKLNDLAREIPTITKDIYISVLKKYENDDLSIPFEVIESELSTFEKDMRKKYDEYLASQKEEEEEILPDVTKEENEDLDYVVPKEGSNVWFDCFLIPKTAEHKEAAEKFIDYMSRQDIAQKNFDYIYYGTPNKAVYDALDDETKEDYTIFPEEATLNKCEVYKYLGETTDQYYNRLWKELKSY